MAFDSHNCAKCDQQTGLLLAHETLLAAGGVMQVPLDISPCPITPVDAEAASPEELLWLDRSDAHAALTRRRVLAVPERPRHRRPEQAACGPRTALASGSGRFLGRTTRPGYREPLPVRQVRRPYRKLPGVARIRRRYGRETGLRTG